MDDVLVLLLMAQLEGTAEELTQRTKLGFEVAVDVGVLEGLRHGVEFGHG